MLVLVVLRQIYAAKSVKKVHASSTTAMLCLHGRGVTWNVIHLLQRDLRRSSTSCLQRMLTGECTDLVPWSFHEELGSAHCRPGYCLPHDMLVASACRVWCLWARNQSSYAARLGQYSALGGATTQSLSTAVPPDGRSNRLPLSWSKSPSQSISITSRPC